MNWILFIIEFIGYPYLSLFQLFWEIYKRLIYAELDAYCMESYACMVGLTFFLYIIFKKTHNIMAGLLYLILIPSDLACFFPMFLSPLLDVLLGL